MIFKIYIIQTEAGKIWVPSGIAVRVKTPAGIRYRTSFLGWGGWFATRKEAWLFAWRALKFRIKYGRNKND